MLNKWRPHKWPRYTRHLLLLLLLCHHLQGQSKRARIEVDLDHSTRRRNSLISIWCVHFSSVSVGGCQLKTSVMAYTKQAFEENPEIFRNPEEHRGGDHIHQLAVKKGFERLDRRSVHPNKNAVKKGGHGGKFTLDGPYSEQDYAGNVDPALDENDPNYVDPAEEAADKEAEIPVVEVAKVAETGIGKIEVIES